MQLQNCPFFFYVVDYLIVVNGNALQQHISYLVYGASIFLDCFLHCFTINFY